MDLRSGLVFPLCLSIPGLGSLLGHDPLLTHTSCRKYSCSGPAPPPLSARLYPCLEEYRFSSLHTHQHTHQFQQLLPLSPLPQSSCDTGFTDLVLLGWCKHYVFLAANRSRENPRPLNPSSESLLEMLLGIVRCRI